MLKTDAIYMALDDPRDVHSWSGIPHFMGRALEAAGFRLSYLGPLRIPLRLMWRVKGRLLRLRGWNYSNLAEPYVLKSLARQTAGQLRRKQGQVILSCGRPHLSYLNTDLPILFFDDASAPALTKLYPGHTNYHPSVIRNAFAAERRVLEKCRYACYMSDWAAEAALRTYGARFEPKIKVIPIGANLERAPTAVEVEQAIQNRAKEPCNLMFVGVDWERKGGTTAVAVAQELHHRGARVQLHIVGCTPPAPVPEFVQVHGYVSKRTKAGAELLQRLYRESHWFLLPTRAEAYGIAFVEANAYGLPALGCSVGGVTTIVHNGENGQLFALDAAPSAYADCIQNRMQDWERYQALCRSSYQAFVTRLSWRHFGETVRALVVPMLE